MSKKHCIANTSQKLLTLKRSAQECPTWDSMTPEEREQYADQDYCSHNSLSYFSDLYNEVDANEIPEGTADIFYECASYFTGTVNFQCLSESQNRALTLFYLEGYSYRDIAHDLGISEDGARMALVRAKKILVTEYRKGMGTIKNITIDIKKPARPIKEENEHFAFMFYPVDLPDFGQLRI